MEKQLNQFTPSQLEKFEKDAMERVVIAIRGMIGTRRANFDDGEARSILEGSHPRYSAAVSFSPEGHTFAAFTSPLGAYTFEGNGSAMAGGIPRLSLLSFPKE